MDYQLSLLEESEPERESKRTFVDLILPLPLPNPLTYSVPFHLLPYIKIGLRVEVQLGRQGLYSGLVYRIHHKEPDYNTKPILSVLDDEAVVTESQYKLWEWLSEYYLCSLGEIMQAALPAGLKLAGETKLMIYPDTTVEELAELMLKLNSKETFVVESLQKYGELTLEDLQKLMNQKTIQPIIKGLLEKRILFITEELTERYKPKIIGMVALALPYSIEEPDTLRQAFEVVGTKANRQMEALMALIQLLKQQEEVSRKELCDKAGIDSVVLRKMKEKGIFELYDKEISRLTVYDGNAQGNFALSELQQKAFDEIIEQFETKNTVLLHGVTGSGKTQVFVELMEQTIAKGKQVLYLLPEIALTAQIVGRLQKHFGDKIVVYHSKFNKNERVEVWKEVQKGVPIILGARSALFLPFSDLGLIIVDEEHDPSFKQNEPAPRYNARDAAVYLAHLYHAKTLLGTATPSLETYRNVQQDKYGLVEMRQRFGGIAMPKMYIVDAAEETRMKRMKSHFTPQLLEAIQETVAKGEQVILFQNRRGYAPIYHCVTCGWTVECVDCDVSLTYHKFTHDLHCHYCSYHQKLPKQCKACGSSELVIKGFGTEKIEDELQIFLPDIRILRMDLDSVKGREGHDKIIQRFESGEVDVLVGTQMVTKGLDFKNVGLVGVLSADQMLHFPDFRASERTFQLITQVAGRAGRKTNEAKVIIQSFNMKHPVLYEVLKYDFETFISREMKERNDFYYPPFCRIIHIQLRHKTVETLHVAANFFAERLKSVLGERVLGPAIPGISRVRTYYLCDILIKLGLNSVGLNQSKDLIREIHDELKGMKKISSTRVVLNVDPY
jgi:primosomal protein N' (replication factor Y)